jgi:hypothetical protein
MYRWPDRRLVRRALTQHVEIGLIEFALGNELFLDRLVGVGECRVGLVHLGFGLRYLSAGRGIVEFGQKLTLVHQHAFLDVQLHQHTARLRGNLGFVIGRQRRSAVIACADRPTRGLGNFDRDRIGRIVLGVLVLGLSRCPTAIAAREQT